MASPITFGVELEFNLAVLYNDDVIVDPSDTRAIDLPLTDLVIQQTKSFFGYKQDETMPEKLDEDFIFQAKKRCMMYHIRDTLRSMGCVSEIYSADDLPSAWEVTYDATVKTPEKTQYRWVPHEVTSPALPFTPESLELIGKVCGKINSTYITDTNWSTSVHIHISGGITPLDFETMQKLYIFLWAFETQLCTLHPKHRQKSNYCRSMRNCCTMVSDFNKKWGRPPTILEGIAEFYECGNLEELLDKAFCTINGKFMAFNSGNALCWVREPHGSHKPTIECRQHEGTLDGNRIIQWVKLLAEIVQALEIMSPESFAGLLNLADNEKWEKSRKDPSANQNIQAEFGPIPAESTSTIIDILEYLHLKESADYYRNRLHPFAGGAIEENLSGAMWDSDSQEEGGSSESDESSDVQEEDTKEMMQGMMLAGAVPETRKRGSRMEFNAYDFLWTLAHGPDGKRKKALKKLRRPGEEAVIKG